MSHTSTLKEPQTPAPSPSLACQLRRKQVMGRRGPVPWMAEIELENRSGLLLEIEYRMTALQHLNLLVHDSQGNLVSKGHFGDRFAPTLEAHFLRLSPGGKFAANVHLLATMPRGPIAPGEYTVQAVYEYNGFRAESDLVAVTVEKPIE